MFSVTVLRKKTDGDMASDTYEGVVDMKLYPELRKCRIEFKNEDRDDKTVAYDSVHVESPLK